MQLLDLFAGLLWLSSVIFLLYLLDVGHHPLSVS